MFGEGTMLKGKDPWDDDEKETLKEKLKWFCSKHGYRPETEDEDGYQPITLKNFIRACYYELRGWTPIFNLRMLCQKIFRPDHISDDMLWSADIPLAKYILKILRAFKKSERHGYPSDFSEFDPESPYGPWGDTKEEYDKAIEEGTHIGGGPEQWEKELDHMIMAFEYIAEIDGDFKKESTWFKKHFGMDPYEEGYECNKHINYSFNYIKKEKHIGSVMSSQKPNLDEVEWCKETISWHNMELIFYAEACVQWGIEKFGYWFRNLWD